MQAHVMDNFKKGINIVVNLVSPSNGSPNGIDESLRWQICHQTKLEAEASCRHRVNVNHPPSLMFFNFMRIFFNVLIFTSFKNLQDAYIFDFALE